MAIEVKIIKTKNNITKNRAMHENKEQYCGD